MRRNDINSFMLKVHKMDSGCWHFTGYINKAGYGQIKIINNVIHAHRASWILHNGHVPSGLLVCHKCDNPKCVNPDHLFLGTHKDNAIDMVIKGRHRMTVYGQPEYCERGHRLNEVGFKYYPNKQWRACNACMKLRSEKRKQP